MRQVKASSPEELVKEFFISKNRIPATVTLSFPILKAQLSLLNDGF
jgi:hypothetical protein